MKKRAANLNHERVKRIVSIILEWDGAITWKKLVGAIDARCGQTYTRQALARYADISDAFGIQKSRAKTSARKERRKHSPELDAILARADRLERELALLKAQNAALLEQFVRWTYNASMRGLTEAILNEPLPRVDRGQTTLKTGRRTPAEDPQG